jgi:hypothetical protein
MRVCLLRNIANGGKKTTGAEGGSCLRCPAATTMRVAIADHQLPLIERQLPKTAIEAVDPVLTHHRCGGVCAQENRRCGNDPSHQRAARESARVRGVRGERLISREDGTPEHVGSSSISGSIAREKLEEGRKRRKTPDKPCLRWSFSEFFAPIARAGSRLGRLCSERRLKSCQRLSASVFCVLGYDRFDTCLRFLEENV